MNKQITYYDSEIGLLEIVGTGDSIVSILFEERSATAAGRDKKNKNKKAESPELSLPMQECVRQLDEYFKSGRREFSLKLQPEGTRFQKRAWEELQRIPYGETITYGEQAERMGNKKACRAVGGANGKNPLTIVIPCHRVIGQDGSLTGFGAGTWRKEWLLEHERKNSI